MKSSQTRLQPVSEELFSYSLYSSLKLLTYCIFHLRVTPSSPSCLLMFERLCFSPLILPLSHSGMSRSRMNFRSGRRGPAAYMRRKERMLRISIRRMVKTDTFYLMVLSLVALNTICVAIVHHNQPDWLTIFLCGFCCLHCPMIYYFRS